MSTTHLALDIARRAIIASQTNLQVISNNIANAGRPGYSRQRAELRPSPALSYPSMRKGAFVQQLGTGVEVYAINRIRDTFLDHIIRFQVGNQGGYTAVAQAYDQLEVLFDEPSDSGLGASITNFFDSWSDLANNPESASTRANLKEQSQILAGNFNDYDARLKKIREDINTQVGLKTDEANNLLQQLADINVQIMKVEGLGDKANDLKDSRDILVEQLSEIVQVNTVDEADFSMTVMIGGLRVVERDSFTELVKTFGDNEMIDLKLISDVTPPLSGGTLAGLIKARDEILPDFQRKLDALASGIINRVNSIHRKGWGLDGLTGRAFFDDFRTAYMRSTASLPAGTNKDTTLFELGVTSGFFEIQGARVFISSDDVSPDKTMTLGDLLDRINLVQPTVRASLDKDADGNTTLLLGLYNPAQKDDKITFAIGSSNFLSAMNIKGATTVMTPENNQYSNAASRISVSSGVVDNLDAIAAALDNGDGTFPGPGDNANALLIAGLQDNPMGVNNATVGEYYNSMISSLGSRSQSANMLTSNQELLISQLTNQREEISGVNMDEEATKIIEFQRMYEGAARVITVVDGLLDLLINKMGV